jgi:hypothetical protein
MGWETNRGALRCEWRLGTVRIALDDVSRGCLVRVNSRTDGRGAGGIGLVESSQSAGHQCERARK